MKGVFYIMNKKHKKIKKSQLPYQVSTCNIGEIIQAKASNGDITARKAVTKLMGRGDIDGRSNDFRRG